MPHVAVAGAIKVDHLNLIRAMDTPVARIVASAPKSSDLVGPEHTSENVATLGGAAVPIEVVL